MGLALSTYAAPDRSLEAFHLACQERGLDGVELVVQRGMDVRALEASNADAGAQVVALRIETIDAGAASALAAASARWGVPVSVPASAVDDLPNLARIFEGAGARLLISEGSDLGRMLALLGRIREASSTECIGIAWELRPSTESLEDASAILFATRERLGLVRLHGGGPEQREQDGSGVGSVLADLALSRYGGPIVLCPSRQETLPSWSRWLSSRKSAGCGSKTQAGTLNLDVRDVEPRDRLGTILGAYAALARGATMQLTVDHDPSCMYYTLEAQEAEGSFSFRTLEHGPEVWKAEVTKL